MYKNMVLNQYVVDKIKQFRRLNTYVNALMSLKDVKVVEIDFSLFVLGKS